MTPQPSRAFQWLLRHVSSRDAANAAVGDVLDELAQRIGAGRAPRWPRLWINLRTLGVTASLAATSAPRLYRSTRHTLYDAVRSLRRAPAYSLLVIALLAVGMAAGTVTFSVVDAVVLKPLAIEQGDRLVSVRTTDDKFKSMVSPQAFSDIRDRVSGFESVGKASVMSGEIVTIDGVDDEVDILQGSADLFRVLRFAPALGRVWTQDDEARGETGVAVLGYHYWQARFHSDRGVLGQTVTKDVATGRATYRIIGVLGPDSDVPGLHYSSCGLWLPMSPQYTHFGILGRIHPGVSVVQIADQIQQVLTSPAWRPAVTPLLEDYVSRIRGWMLLALGTAGLVVLIACVNAANIMLTRSFRRAHELAIRSSLGASRRTIAMSVMAEGLVLSLAASACALLFAAWGISAARVAVTTYLAGTFRASTIALNGRVLAAAIAAAVVTGILSSLVPAWHASRASVQGILKDAAPTVAGGGRRWRSGLLIGEIACVTVLLVVSWLFASSLVRVISIDLGIDRSHLVAVMSRSEFNGTVDAVHQRLESVPGVIGVAEVRGASLPLIGRAFGGAWGTTTIERVDAAGEPLKLKVLDYRVTPNYFDVAGIRFRRGGTWGPDMSPDSRPVVIDERAAIQLFAGDDPLGRQVRATAPAGTFAVVGVVPHVYARGPEDAAEPQAYFALPPSATRNYAGLFVRTTQPADVMVPVITEAIAAFAPAGNSRYVFQADEAVQRITATRRFNGGLMSAFGVIAMLIGGAGIYGVMSALVAQQTREIGVRVALGATPRDISQRVLTRAGTHVISGIAVGLPLAWWLSRGFAAYLFQVTPTDLTVYAGVAVLVGLVGLAAALIPARRAARTDPTLTLRA